MAEVLHGLIQHAKLTAEQSGYQVKKATRGWNVWRQSSSIGWTAIAMFADQQDAIDFVAGLIATRYD